MLRKTAISRNAGWKTLSNPAKGLLRAGKLGIDLPHVKMVTARGRRYAYFNMGPRNDGRYEYRRLPTGSASEFNRAYKAFTAERERLLALPKTIDDAIQQYTASSWFARLQPRTQSQYNLALGRLSEASGQVLVAEAQNADLTTALNGIEGKAARSHTAKIYCSFYSWLRREAKVSPSCTPDAGLFSKRKAGSGDYVYFIQAGDGPIKIGRANDLSRRILMLQSGNHLELRLLASVRCECAVSAEAKYHRQFVDHRTRGEWFNPHPDILAEIERLSQ